MEGTTEVPGIGKIKKAYIFVPAGLALGYVAFKWYQASQAPPPDPTADGIYGNEDLSEYGMSTSGGATTVTGNNGVIDTDGTSDTAIDDNREWSNVAAEKLANAGYDQAVVYAALGEFLARRALDKAEASIARAAIAAAGQPPEGRLWSVLEEAGEGTGTLAAPTNVRAWQTNSDSQIGFQWDAVPGALYYRIYRTDITTEPMGASTDTKFWARGLQPNTSYTFYVRAMNTLNKEGGKSSNYAARTKAVTLTRPTGLKSSNIQRTSFRVTCSPVKGATYYRWYVNGRGVTPSDRPYQDFTGMKANTTYSIAVVADTTNQNPGPISSVLRVKTKR